MKYKGFTLDKFQEDSIKKIDKDYSVVVSAPTGSGKTLIADYIINKDIDEDFRVVYTAPIKALSNQKYKEFSEEYGKEKIGLLTGDVVINPGAKVLIMTTEIYRNMVLTDDSGVDNVKYVIFDEIHYINDVERGYVWEESIIFSKKHVRFLCLSATIPNAKEFAEWIQAIKGHKVDVVKHTKRPVPLKKAFFDAELGITTLEQIKEVKNIPNYNTRRGKRRKKRFKAPSHIDLVMQIRNKLPCFFFTFSRKKCQKQCLELYKKKIFKFNKDIIPVIRSKLSDKSSDINNLKSTKLLRKTLPYGIAFHHAGLLPIIKELVEELFGLGMIKVLYTTETFAVGINMPAKTVCFEGMRKYDGISFRFLNSKEYFQIAGRAGRRGIDDKGFVYAMIDRRDFDYSHLKKITSKDMDSIQSQFRLSVNTVLNLIKMHNSKEIEAILCKSFHSYQKYGSFNPKKKNMFSHRFESIKKKLLKMNYLFIDEGIEGSPVGLTNKGEFSSQIYADELLVGEIFATEFKDDLTTYEIFLLLACICYEPKERTKFFKKFVNIEVKRLESKIGHHKFLKRKKNFKSLKKITALIWPCYKGKDIFDIIDNTNLLEGDVIRFFRQILDRIGQILKATDDNKLIEKLDAIRLKIIKALKDIDVV
jgi:superfamily II RNA helicase